MNRPQKAKFQQFLVMENLNWSLKSHWIVFSNCCGNPAGTVTVTEQISKKYIPAVRDSNN